MENELIPPNEEQQVAYGKVGDVDLTPENEQVIEPEVIEHKYPAPFNSKIGNSSVDLSIAGSFTTLEENLFVVPVFIIFPK